MLGIIYTSLDVVPGVSNTDANNPVKNTVNTPINGFSQKTRLAIVVKYSITAWHHTML